jgi:acyl-CoA synthetase (AMP-forming)/AMP-acid ligase II
VRAIVVRRAGTAIDEAALTAHCREHLGGFQCPRTIGFVDALPRTATGKVLKRSLREAFWSGQARQVGEV